MTRGVKGKNPTVKSLLSVDELLLILVGLQSARPSTETLYAKKQVQYSRNVRDERRGTSTATKLRCVIVLVRKVLILSQARFNALSFSYVIS